MDHWLTLLNTDGMCAPTPLENGEAAVCSRWDSWCANDLKPAESSLLSTPKQTKKQFKKKDMDDLFSPQDSNSNSGSCSSRHENSLGVLTKRFLALLWSSPDGLLNLSEASVILGVAKRRIYDITNVLEGIELIRKSGKNNVIWCGNNSVDSESSLCDEIKCLMEKEAQLDEFLNTLNATAHDVDEQLFYYVTHKDMADLKELSKDTILIIKAPTGTLLDIPNDDDMNFHVCLRSRDGPVEVYLCPENNDHEEPSSKIDGNYSETSSRELEMPHERVTGAEELSERSTAFLGTTTDNQLSNEQLSSFEAIQPESTEDFLFCFDGNNSLHDLFGLDFLDSSHYDGL